MGRLSLFPCLPCPLRPSIKLNKTTTKQNKGIIYFSPLIIKSMLGGGGVGSGGGKGGAASATTSNVKVLLLTAIPFVCAVVVQLIVAFSSYTFDDRRFHVCGCWAFGALMLALTSITGAFGSSATAAFGLLVLSIVGIHGPEGVLVSFLLALQGGEKVFCFFCC